MSEPLKHWRYGGKITHIGVEVLPDGKDITVTIDRIDFIEKEKVRGKEESHWVAYFKPNPYFKLPMILNPTNRKRLVKQTGTDYLQTIKNFNVILTKEETKDPEDGGKIYGLRISKIKATQGKVDSSPSKIELNENSGNFGMIKKWLKEQGGTIEGVKAKYDVTEDTIKKLLE